MTEAASVLAPDADVMAQFLEHAFGGYLDGLHDGLVEIACSSNQGDKPKERWWSRLFGTDELDDAVAYAAEQNSKHGINLYFAPALRDKASPRDKRGNKANVIGTLLLWCEWDDEASFGAAKEKFTFAKPTAGELTGIIPEKRAQAFWRLKTAIVGTDDIDAAINGLCAALGGDPKVVHADCLMRLPGSISWRKLDKPERQDEMTRLEIGRTDRPASYPVEQILQAYPPVPRVASGVSYPAPGDVTRHSALGLGGAVVDGRETYMRNTVLACLIEFVGTHGAAPTSVELFEMVWPQYSANVDFSRPGRGADEVKLKCASTVQRFTSGRITGLWSLEDAVAAYAKKKAADPGPLANPEPPNTDPGPFPASSFAGQAPKRQWLVQDWLPVETVTALYGDGGIGKTLLAQQLATAYAVGGQWCGMSVPKGVALGVFCEDDYNELWRRQDDIDRGAVGARHALGDLHLWPRVGFDNVLQNFNRDGIGKTTAFYDRLELEIARVKPGLLILDTAADIFGGNEIIRSQVNQFVKAALGHFVVKYGVTILLVAHPSLSGMASGTGTSGSTAWNNSVRSRWYLEKPETALPSQRVLTRKKANYASSGDDQNIQLVWESGILTTQPRPDTVDRIELNSLKNMVADAIGKCWDQGTPIGTSRSSRPVKETLPRLLKGQEPALVMRAFVELERDGYVSCQHGNTHKRGYKVMRNVRTGEMNAHSVE